MEGKSIVYTEEAQIVHVFKDNQSIRDYLLNHGVQFEQWKADEEVTENSSSEDILNAYQTEIKKLVDAHSYKTWDVISLGPEHPDKLTLRNKFLSEHTHSEDEVRFFVRGKRTFCYASKK